MSQILGEEYQAQAPYNTTGFAEVSGSKDQLDEPCDARSLGEIVEPHRAVKRKLNRWQIFVCLSCVILGWKK